VAAHSTVFFLNVGGVAVAGGEWRRVWKIQEEAEN